MVEYVTDLDAVFKSLADPTRRDILQMVSGGELSVSDIAQQFSLSFAAISKHIKVLEKAQLVTKRRSGKQQYIQISPNAFQAASDYLRQYHQYTDLSYETLSEYMQGDILD